MQSKNIIKGLVALGQETRLATYRLLIEVGDGGLPSGEIAERIGANPSTMSRHLAQLERAGLISSARKSRNILYTIDWEGTEALTNFLTKDCCKQQVAVKSCK